MSFSSLMRTLSVCVFLLTLASPTRAGIIYQHNFEAPTWQFGTDYAVTGSPESSVGLFTNDGAISTIITSPGTNGSQALTTRYLASLNPTYAYSAIGFSFTLPPDLSAYHSIIYSADVRIDGPANAAIRAGLLYASDVGDDSGVYITGDGRGATFLGGNTTDSGPAALGAFHRLSMTYSVPGRTTSYAVDGIVIASRYHQGKRIPF